MVSIRSDGEMRGCQGWCAGRVVGSGDGEDKDNDSH